MKIEKPMTDNQKFYGNKLYKFLKESEDFVTKDKMLEYLGWDKSKDRQLRDLLSLIGQKKPLISMSSDRGYKIATSEKDLQLVEHTWAELSSRVEVLQSRIAPLIEFRDKHKFGNGD